MAVLQEFLQTSPHIRYIYIYIIYIYIYIRLTSIYKPGIEYATFPGTAPQVFGFIEFYAGMANCSKCHRLARIPTASLDILYHKAKPGKASYMDILTTPGMAFLGPT